MRFAAAGTRSSVLLFATFVAAARSVLAQEGAQAPQPPEGSVIINLPSADPIREGSLQLLINHRFSDPVQGSTLHSFFSFFSGTDVAVGLSYAPLRGLEAGFLRGQTLEDWEVFAKYGVLSSPDSPLHAAVRIGGDIKGQKDFADRASFFAQAVVAFTIAGRVRVSAVPTFSTQATGQQDSLGGLRRANVLNVPLAISGRITRSINILGEFVPREDSPGAAWIAAIEKTVPRHRFSFSVGSLRDTTVDQYVASDFRGLSPHNIYFGFNIIRQWKLK